VKTPISKEVALKDKFNIIMIHDKVEAAKRQPIKKTLHPQAVVKSPYIHDLVLDPIEFLQTNYGPAQ
jgi:hypothetical protein